MVRLFSGYLPDVQFSQQQALPFDSLTKSSITEDADVAGFFLLHCAPGLDGFCLALRCSWFRLVRRWMVEIHFIASCSLWFNTFSLASTVWMHRRLSRRLHLKRGFQMSGNGSDRHGRVKTHFTDSLHPSCLGQERYLKPPNSHTANK